MAGKQKTLEDAFYETLRDVYYAEKQSVRALGKSARAAESDDLRAALERHRDESNGQVERLEKVFEIIGKSPRTRTCEAIQGLAAEMQEGLDDFSGSPAADAVLIGSAQAIEHYEIARYGTLRSWAEQLGHADAVRLIEETLEEEKRTDKLLTELAGRVNRQGGTAGEAAGQHRRAR